MVSDGFVAFLSTVSAGSSIGLGLTYSLHCSSFLGLPYRILIVYLVKPKKGTTMETVGSALIVHDFPAILLEVESLRRALRLGFGVMGKIQGF